MSLAFIQSCVRVCVCIYIYVHQVQRVSRSDEEHAPFSLYVRVKYCLLLLLIVSTSFIRVVREETNVGILLTLLVLLLPLLSSSSSEHIDVRARIFVGENTKVSHNCSSVSTMADYHRSFLREVDGFSVAHAHP